MAVDEYRFRAMASAVHVIVVDGPPEAGAVARRALEQLESTWSRFIETSDISRLNRSSGHPIQVAPATITLLNTVAEACRMTGGLFDPTVLPALINAGYATSIDDPRAHTSLPDAAVFAPLERFSFEQVTINKDLYVTLPIGMAIDVGGLGKGLAADLVVAELLGRGAGGALVSVGGDLAAAGHPPEPDGWRVDVEDPFSAARILTHISINGGGVATSSTRSRRWNNNGEQHHVIDPTTGKPSQSDLAAVTVIGSCGWEAEAHATALLLGGRICFGAYVTANQIEAIGTAIDGTTVATNGLSELVPTEVMSS